MQKWQIKILVMSHFILTNVQLISSQFESIENILLQIELFIDVLESLSEQATVKNGGR